MTLALRLAADAVARFHRAFVRFVAFGGLLAWLHLPAAAWGAWAELAGWNCPLTPLENALRRVAGESGDAGGFIGHYWWPLLHPVGLTRERPWAPGAGVLGLHGVVYGVLLVRRARSPGPRARGKTARG